MAKLTKQEMVDVLWRRATDEGWDLDTEKLADALNLVDEDDLVGVGVDNDGFCNECGEQVCEHIGNEDEIKD